ncbi:choice-of-anchor D domain-containing protein [Aquimarina sp. ERC-38]|uniref:Ig-like domain-containing protein n=1 Tax=Aquimarina sp. ERC-38 TaxID=2949996 RepID=UPI00224740FB|nr:choice-of-anchor D domain-containing protein [Aquimarina sp. ERC-38]UZO81572.1 choice-of-anchor D domain-containing protein [Aquimarina sp. ERC-38]
MKKNFYTSSFLGTMQFFKRWGLLLWLLSLFSYVTHAQKVKHYPGVIVTCPADFEAKHTKHGIPEIPNAKLKSSLKQNATAEFIVTFGPGAEANPRAKAAFEFALDIWANEIVSSVPIRAFVDFATFDDPGVLAAAGPTYLSVGFPNAPDPIASYPAPLANALAGETLLPVELDYDFTVSLGDGFEWYYGTDGNAGPGQFDFITVALHEIGHGLGFLNVNSIGFDGLGTLRGSDTPDYSVFSNYIVNGNDESIKSFPDPSEELANELTSDDLFVNSPFAVEALGGTLPKIYAPFPYRVGSSISHWDEDAFPAGDPNSLMTPVANTQESNFDIGNITRGFFRDMGWEINGNFNPVTSNPSRISEELFVNNELQIPITLSNPLAEPAEVTASIKNGSEFISITSETNFEIAPSGTDTLKITLSTINVPKGIFRDTIVLATAGFDNIREVPVSLRILDGTEIAVLSIDQDSLNETVDLNNTAVRELSIRNLGDDPLTYSIAVQDEDGNDVFPLQVAKTKSFIEKNGFKKITLDPPTSGNPLYQMVYNKDKTANQLNSSLYATDFEDFELGRLNEQIGWFAAYEDNWVISDDNPKEGSLHIRGESDGLGSTREFGEPLAISPRVTPVSNAYTAFSADVQIQGDGNTWQLLPQNATEGLVVTRIIFNPDKSIDILNLENGGELVRIPQTVPDGYFKVSIEVSGILEEFSVFFDDELVFTGIPFGTFMEEVALVSDMAVAGGTMDVDNFEITDFNEDGFFVSVAPRAGEVAIADSTEVRVVFDSRGLDKGVYTANLKVSSNDSINSPVNIPVSLTVALPPTIVVTPDSLNVAINVQTDVPAVKTETFTISNAGESPLEYTTAVTDGSVQLSALANKSKAILDGLNLKDYGLGNTKKGTWAKDYPNKLSSSKTSELKNLEDITDSIFYDSGESLIPFLFGFSDPDIPVSSAIRFDVSESFTLSAIRNGFRANLDEDIVVILEIYKGGSTPNEGELLLTQAIEQESAFEVIILEELTTKLQFQAGDSFWVVHKYPTGVRNPVGYDDLGILREGANLVSSDGGANWVALPSFNIYNRALGSKESLLVIEPSSGTLAPRATQEVAVTFAASNFANGVYKNTIAINSNDPVTPQAEVHTTLEISGQVNDIELLDEVVLFNDVFIGSTSEKTITIVNNGLGSLTLNELSTDIEDFTLSEQSAIVNSKDSLVVSVTFTPRTTGNINSILSIKSDNADNPELTVVLNGVGVEPPVAVLSPDEVNLEVEAGSTTTSTVTLENEGNAPLIYSFPEVAVTKLLNTKGLVLNNTGHIDYGVTKSLTKDALGSRKGHNVVLGAGSDDNFGYTWIDSDEDGGPVFNFEDISTTGIEVTLDVGLDQFINVPLPFTFDFYGSEYTDIYISENGFLSFNQPGPTNAFNDQIPFPDDVNNIISAMWSDLARLPSGSMLHYQNFDDKFIVQWTTFAELFSNPDESVTFQIVLYPDGNIDIFYDDVSTARFLDIVTVGIENTNGSDGIQVAFNTEYIKDNLAVRFIKPDEGDVPFITGINKATGAIPAQGSATFTVTIDGTDLSPGLYFDELVLSSNSVDKSRSSTLFNLTVLEANTLTVDRNDFLNSGFKVNNPVSDVAIYQISNQKNARYQLKLLTLTGQQMYSSDDFILDSSGKGSLDVSNLAKGVYILILSDLSTNISSQKKIIKQ